MKTVKTEMPQALQLISLLAALMAPAAPPKRPPVDLIFEVTYRVDMVAVDMDCWKKYEYVPP